jgi:hypothetical protein
MKKLRIYLIAIALLLAIQPLQLNAATIKDPIEILDPKTKTAESEKAKTLVLRLNEINEMDKSNLKSSEKKELRREVREIKTELKATEARGGGVYLSVGAIIIIVLLLIILL